MLAACYTVAIKLITFTPSVRSRSITYVTKDMERDVIDAGKAYLHCFADVRLS